MSPRRLRCFLATALAVVLVGLPGPGRAQNIVRIGGVEMVRVSAFGTVTGRPRAALQAEAEVFADELLETVPDAALHVRFVDDTDVRMGENSRMRLDRFVFDPDRNTGEMVAAFQQGVFRFVTGRLNSPAYQLVTPSAIIGVRGTDLGLKVFPNGAVVVAVFAGQVIVTGFFGPPVIVFPGATASVPDANSPATNNGVSADFNGNGDDFAAAFFDDPDLSASPGTTTEARAGAAPGSDFGSGVLINPPPPVVLPIPTTPPPVVVSPPQPPPVFTTAP